MEVVTVVLSRIKRRAGTRKHGFVELFVSKRLIQGLAAAMMSLFLPIFIYETSGNSFTAVGIFFIVASWLYALLLVPAMKITNVVGFHRILVVGGLFSVLQFTLLYFTSAANWWYMGWLMLLALTGFRLFHWVPYHVDFTAFTSDGERGRDVSLMFATIAFMGMIGPILAGYIITQSGYDVLFGVVIVLLVMATVSYSFVPSVQQYFEWSYRDTFRYLFSPQYRHLFMGEFANGAETIVTLVAWPIFLYVILDGNLLEVGLISTVIVAITIGVQLMVGKYLDKAKENKIKTLRRGSVLYAAGWLFKMFVLSSLQVFLVGLYHNITRIFIKTPYSAILYDMSGEQGKYVDEFTVMREIASYLGRGFAVLIMVVLTWFVPIEISFLIGVVASLAVNFVYHRFG